MTIIILILYTLQTQYPLAPLSLNLTFSAFQSSPQRLFQTYFPYQKLNLCNQMILLRGHHDRVFFFSSLKSQYIPLSLLFLLLWWILNGDKRRSSDLKMEMDNMITDDESQYPSPPTLFVFPSSFCLSICLFLLSPLLCFNVSR